MTRIQSRRRLSLALPALAFLSFSVLETVELSAVADTILAFNAEEPQPAHVLPASQTRGPLHCPRTT
jgi:hypothetical protein